VNILNTTPNKCIANVLTQSKSRLKYCRTYASAKSSNALGKSLVLELGRVPVKCGMRQPITCIPHEHSAFHFPQFTGTRVGTVAAYSAKYSALVAYENTGTVPILKSFHALQ